MEQDHLQLDNHNIEFDLQSYLVYQTQRCPRCMQMRFHGISTGSVDNTHEWMSFDTPSQKSKS